MEASKTEVPKSKLVDKIRNDISTAMYMFSRSSYPMGLSQMLYDQTGSDKSNMVAFKPEVPISKLVDKIRKKVQRLCIRFRGPCYPIGLTGVYCDLIPESVFQKWRP